MSASANSVHGERLAAAAAQRNRGGAATVRSPRRRQNSLSRDWLRHAVGGVRHPGAPILKYGRAVLQTPCDVHVPAQRTGRAICPRCGRPMLSSDATDTMLAILARLARFGLDAEGRPLLTMRTEER